MSITKCGARKKSRKGELIGLIGWRIDAKTCKLTMSTPSIPRDSRPSDTFIARHVAKFILIHPLKPPETAKTLQIPSQDAKKMHALRTQIFLGSGTWQPSASKTFLVMRGIGVAGA